MISLQNKVVMLIKSKFTATTPNYWKEHKRLLVRRYITMNSINNQHVKSHDLEKTLITGCKVLEDLGVKYWVASGTLLGLNRDGDFLKNDYEIDVDVYTDKDVYKIIKELPFIDIVRIVSHDNRYMQFALVDKSTDVIFDIWFYYPKGSKLMNRNDYGIFWYPSKKFTNLTTIRYNGNEYPCPDPDWYCEFVYGKSWRTPKQYQKHWTYYYTKDCKGFRFTGNANVREENYY